MSEVPADVLDTTEAGPKVVRGSALRILGHVAGSVLSVGATALMMRHLGVVDAGRLVTVLALAAMVAAVSDFGLTWVGLREYTVLTGAARERFMRSLLGMRVVLTAIAVAAAVLFAVAVGYTDEMVVGTALAGLGAMLYVLHNTLATPLSTQLRLGWVTGFQFAVQLLMAALIAGLVVLDAGLVAFLAVQIPAMVPVLAATAIVVRGQTPLMPALDPEEWQRVLRDVLPYAVAAVLAVVYFRLVAVLVSLLSTDEETGYFGASFRVLDALSLIPPLLVSTAFPVLARAARDDRERLSYAMTRVSEAMMIIGGWAAVCIVVGADFLIAVVAGPDFEPSVAVLELQGPAVLGTFLVATWGYSLLALRRHREILVCNLGALALAAVLSVWLIQAHGAEGGAVALTATELSLAGGYAIVLGRADAGLEGVPRLLPRLSLALVVAALVPVLAGLPSVLAIVVASAIYFAILSLTRSIPVEVVSAFTSQRRSQG